MTFTMYSLGCKVNQYETQAMEKLLTEHGHTAVSDHADAVIVNTCAVTAESTRKSRQTVRRLIADNPGAVIAVCGCYSQISPEDVQALGADIVFGSGNHLALLEALEARMAAREAAPCRVSVDDPFQRRQFELLPAGSMSGRTRAMLKIEDGCDNFCTYCVIPYARGRVRSMPVAEAAAEAERLCAEGYRELVITGIEISSYGKDLKTETGEKLRLSDVICAVSKAAPGSRLHLGSLEPTVVTEEFCEKLAGLGNLCNHFHLSMQSGCDRTLRAMHRKYDTALFLEVVNRLRRYFPGCALTTDLITGFPGETQEDHEETLRFIRKCAFASMHIFPYSERPGTPAATMPGRVDKAVRAARAHEAQAAADEMEQEFLRGCVGKTLSVLFETEEGGRSFGHAENYCFVETEGINMHNVVQNMKITGISGKNLVGIAVGNDGSEVV